MSKKRVLVVDDSAFMRSVITRQIEKDDRLELCDTAKDGVEAVEKALRLKPDVITMDIEMPNKNGLEALEEIMQKCPTRVVMVSSLTKQGAQETMRALELGAVDFFPKSMDDSSKSIFAQGETLREKLYNAASISKLEKVTSMADEKPAEPSKPQPESQLRFKKAKIVLVGISTGGPKALHTIMPQFPGSLRVPVIIVQHMPPNFTAAMASRLNQLTALTVMEAEDGLQLQEDHIYIVPGGSQCTVKEHTGRSFFKVDPDESNSIYKPSVEVTADSLHNVYGGDVIALMMTGMGSDGLKGFGKLKEAGAYVIAQNEETCVVYGMPKAVVDKGLANEVIPLMRIPETLERLLN